MNNEELKLNMQAIHGGDRDAFEELYKGMKTPIFTVIFRITWDRPTSEDILQEVFIKLFLSPPEPSIRNPRAYILQMARNLAIDGMRKQAQHVSFGEIEDTVGQPIDDIAMRMDIDDALKKLPPQECQIVTLHVIGELKFREISELLKIPLGTVLWQYQKAISKLQKMIIGG